MQFLTLASAFQRIEATAGRIAMTEVLAELFRAASPEEARQICYLIQGRVAPTFVPLEFGVGDRLLISAIAAAFAIPSEQVKADVKTLGDHGLAAEKYSAEAGGSRSVGDVFAGLTAIARTGGEGSMERKVEQLVAMMRELGPLENRYFARIPMDRLRLGVGDPTLMDGLSYAKAGDKSQRESIERAYNYVSDLGLVAERYVGGGLEGISEIRVEVGNPVRMAQAERLSSGSEIVAKVGRCAVEPKFDGFRLQLHRLGDEVRIYSRNLEDMTGMFPELAAAARTQLCASTAIIEGEAMGYDPETLQFVPFQVTVSRRRKHDIDRMAGTLPLKLLAFDVLFAGGEDLTPLPYAERRARLLELIEPSESIGTTESLVTDDPKEIDAFFADKVEAGLEGILAKRLDSPYQAGKRNFNWIKLKRSYKAELSDTLDCAIVGYWLGRGKRASWGIGALLTSVWDEKESRLKTVARVGSGLSDKEWVELRELLDKDKREGAAPELDTLMVADVWVKPRYVVEVLADELTRSPNHTAGRTEEDFGYALRFPRVLGMPRADKAVRDATTVSEVAGMFDAQVRAIAAN